MTVDLVKKLPPRNPGYVGRGVGVAIINYNTTKQTIRALESLRHATESPCWIALLDNGPRDDSLERAIECFEPYQEAALTYYRSPRNTGFAEGCNILIEQLLMNQECGFVLLINNDAVAFPKLISAMVDALESSPGAGLAGCRMHKLNEPDRVDTLGISIYRSLMPADRHSLNDFFLGPTGGCALISRPCLDDLYRVAGYWFDPRYFCYCEDTDLVLRANLMGYQPVFVDETLALHEGQASSGGGGTSDFIIYHGIRNSIWMVLKLMPAGLLVRYGAFLVFAHLMTVVRHLVSGNFRLILRVYRDAFSERAIFLAERKLFSRSQVVDSKVLMRKITSRFYRAGYVKTVMFQLWQCWQPKG